MRVNIVSDVHGADGALAKAAEGSDAVALITEWSEFRNPDFPSLKAVMR